MENMNDNDSKHGKPEPQSALLAGMPVLAGKEKMSSFWMTRSPMEKPVFLCNLQY